MFDDAEKAVIIRGHDPRIRHTEVTAPLYAEAADLGEVETMQYVDLGTWLPGDILVKADRMSMAHSLEVRVPILDRAVFAAAAGLPTSAKLPRGSQQTKLALREAVSTIVPPDVVYRAKLGFPTPIRIWLRSQMFDWAADILSSSSAGELLDLSWGLQALSAHRRGEAELSRKIWTLLVFCLWCDTTVTEPPAMAKRPQRRPGGIGAPEPTG
jgi:asparagine synthase (glutamine-hydrolysing)